MPAPEPAPPLADFSAALAAKVAAPASDAATLRSIYEGMARDWAEGGPTPAALAATAQFYSSDNPPAPRPYSSFTPQPLAPGAVRLLAFFLLPREGGTATDGGGSALASAALAAADAVAAALPPGARLHRSTPPGLHLTLFMTSQPFALCRDPFSVDGGGGGGEDGGLLSAPTPGVVEREVAATAALAAGVPRGPALEAHSVVLAPSGALLLLLTEVEEEGEGTDGGGVVAGLRRAARAAFPGAPKGSQSSILHVTLGRLLSPVADARAIAAVAAAAKAATATVRGLRWSPPALSHISETVFATVAGPRVDTRWG